MYGRASIIMVCQAGTSCGIVDAFAAVNCDGVGGGGKMVSTSAGGRPW
jgi:hypothetical protein